MKKYSFVASWRDKRSVTVVEVDDFFQNRSSIDTIVSGSMEDAIRIFNQRHTIVAWGKEIPKYTIVSS